jgi:hypothetical protein
MQYESAEKESSRSLVSLQGLDGKHLVFCRRGEAFVLTSSFIERGYRNVAFWLVFQEYPLANHFEKFLGQSARFGAIATPGRGAPPGLDIPKELYFQEENWCQ